jgi:ubiquinone/menaquinone biosynthesis C-methylase UbiE
VHERMKIRTLSREDYREHLDKYGQYAVNPAWNEWYSGVVGLKGERVVKTILGYKGKEAKVMDLGCGVGMTLSVLGGVFPKAIGVDVFEKEVKASREILKKCRLRNKVVKYNGRKLPFGDNTFDVVTSIEVIEHVEDPEQMLGEIKRVLKGDGILHITTANKLWPVEPHFKLWFLSYLPPKWADWYVRVTGRGEGYQGIHLPTYGQFRRTVEEYFEVEDITLAVVKENKKYGLDRERGFKVVWLGKIVGVVEAIDKFIGRQVLEGLVLNLSLGWLLIGRPKK